MNAPNQSAQFSQGQLERIGPINTRGPHRFRLPVERCLIAALLLGGWGRTFYLLIS